MSKVNTKSSVVNSALAASGDREQLSYETVLFTHCYEAGEHDTEGLFAEILPVLPIVLQNLGLLCAAGGGRVSRQIPGRANIVD